METSPTIITPSEPLIVGIPVNKKLTEDLKAFTDGLELEGSRGRLTSPKFKNAVFRPLRTDDIVKLLESESPSRMCMGISGIDTFIENRLRKLRFEPPPSWVPEYAQKAAAPSPKQVLTINSPPTSISLLIREEDEEKLKERAAGNVKEWPRPTLVTSYPEIAKTTVGRTLSKLMRVNFLNIIDVCGQAESILRNKDFDDSTDFALDIVRTGKTAQEFGLKTFGEPVLISRPRLFLKGGIEKPNRQVGDLMEFIREQLISAGLDTDYLFSMEEIRQWRITV